MDLRVLFEADNRKVLCLFPGGFHPFHAGHASVYQYLVDKFPTADVYVASSNNTKERPFPFKQKQFLASQAGIPPKRFVEVASPYRADEITKHYDPNNTILIFALSEKDKDRLGKPTKKDGSPSYMQPYPGSTEKCETFNKHGYYVVTPTIKFSVLNQPITSASQIREMYKNADDTGRMAIVKSMYPGSKKPSTIKDILDGVLVSPVTESSGGKDSPITDEGWVLPDGSFKSLRDYGTHYKALVAHGLSEYEHAYKKGWIRVSVIAGYRQDIVQLECSLPIAEAEDRLENIVGRYKEAHYPDRPQFKAICGTGPTHGLYEWDGREFVQARRFGRLREGKLYDEVTDDGWFTPEQEFYPNEGRAHIETVRLYGMKNLNRAYEAGWIHFYSSVGSVGIMTTSLPYSDVESYVDEIAKQIEPRYPTITLECKNGLYEWDGKQFSIRKANRVSEAVDRADRIKQNGWITTKNQFLENPVGTGHFTALPRYNMHTYEEAYDAGWIRFSVDYKNRAFFETTFPFDKVEKRLVKLAKQSQGLFPEIFAYTGKSHFGIRTDKYEWDGKQFKQLYGAKVYESLDVEKLNSVKFETINCQDGVSRIIMAKYKGKIVGEINTIIDRQTYTATMTSSNIIFPDWKGVDLGQLLYDHAIADAKAQGCVRFRSSTVRVDASNTLWKRLIKRYNGKFVNKGINDSYFTIDLKNLPPKINESPDFGYTHFNDRDNDLSKLKWDVVDDKANGVIAIRAFSDNPGSKNEPRLQFMAQRYGEFDGLIIGRCWGDDGTTVQIDQSRVTDDWKGTGLGQMMYDKLIDLAKKKGFKKVKSDTSMSADARRAWRRLSQRYPVQTKEIPWRPTESYYFIDLQGAT